MVAIATGKLAGRARFSPGGPNEVGRSPCLGMGLGGVRRRTWYTHGIPTETPARLVLAKFRCLLDGALKVGRSYRWRCPSLELCPQSSHLENDDDDDDDHGMPSHGASVRDVGV